MQKISTQNNFIYLFIALVTLLFSMAFLKQIQTSWLHDLVQVVLFFVFILGVHSLKSDRSWMWAVYVMAFIMIAVFIVKKLFIGSDLLIYINLLLLLSFFIGSFILSFKQIIMSEVINQNMIIGSIVLYLLLGLIWSVIYLLILNIYPDAFNGLEALPWQDNFSRVAYYSFVTLTTLGYGDISANNPISEFFVYAEAIVGVFYMAIIVSTLVSARMNSFKSDVK